MALLSDAGLSIYDVIMSCKHVIRAAAWAVLWLALACGSQPDAAEPLRIAVAANFSGTQRRLAERYQALTGTEVVPSVGSSAQLYAQIQNGAPFHVFLSADQERPQRLEGEGLAVPGSRFSYAEGRLTLYGPGLDSVKADGADLRQRTDVRVSIANPDVAPYGAAAMAVIQKLGLTDSLAPRIVRGESVAQAEQFVRSGAAELGFVALSQVIREPRASYWLVPLELHSPILQDGVLLEQGRDNTAARRYLDFLRSAEARRIIEEDGYSIPAAGR